MQLSFPQDQERDELTSRKTGLENQVTFLSVAINTYNTTRVERENFKYMDGTIMPFCL